MGLFKKKSDPISDRARELNKKIADLEEEIKRLAEKPEAAEEPHPKLKPATFPQGRAPAEDDDIFLEAAEQRRLKEREAPDPRPELGTAKADIGSAWRRFKNNFRGPATSNPKLVSYLAAGSIQGLRPLRYEKRVARNRFIVLSGILILLLWGILAIFFRHR